MKKLLLAMLLAPLAVLAETDYSEYARVMSDSGSGMAAWTMASGIPVVKTLDVNFDPAAVKKAALEYELLLPTYDTKHKVRVTSESHKWKKLLIRLNKKVIFNDYPGKLLLKGTHAIDFPPEYLKKGKNTIIFGWDKKDKSDGAAGYIYVAIDKDAPQKIIKLKPGKDGKVRTRRIADNDSIRIRFLVKMY